MADRVLVLDIGEDVQFDANAAESGVALSNGNRTVARGATAASGFTRTRIARAGGKLYARFRIDAINGSRPIVGVVNANALVSATTLINDPNGWGYTADGRVMSNGAVISGPHIAVGVGGFVGVAVDIAAGKLWVEVNGVWVNGGNPATGANPAATGITGSLFLAASLNLANTGATLFVDDVDLAATCPAGFVPWGTFGRVASRGLTTAASDTPANIHYEARIAPDGNPIYRRAVSCVLWDRGGVSGAPLGDIELMNTDGVLDTWATMPMRGLTLRARIGIVGSPVSGFTNVATAMIDRAYVASENRLRIVLSDPGKRLDKPAQASLFDGTAPNTALAGAPRPLLLGQCIWVALTQLDPATLEYALADRAFGGVTELRDQGVVITPLTGWDAGARADNVGVRRVTNPAGKQVASARGLVKLGAAFVDGSNGGDFTTWAGGVPSGWSEQSSGAAPNDVSQVASTARFQSNGAGNASLFRAGLVNGQLYYVEITVSARTSGRLMLQQFGVGSTVLAYMDRVGTFRFAFVSTASQGTLELRIPAGEAGDITASRVRVTAATVIERLPDWLTELCVTRGGLALSDLDLAGSIATLDATVPWRLNYFTDQAVKIPDLLKRTMDSFLGWSWWDRTGKLKVGRLIDPAAASASFTFTDIELVGPIGVEEDLAPGLSTIVVGQRNYSPHADGEIAGSVLLTADAGRLVADYLVRKVGASTLAATYWKAVGAAPMETLLSQAADVQSLADYGSLLYAVPRAFYTFSAYLDDLSAYSIEPGTVVNLQTSLTKRFGLTAGKNVLVVSAESRLLSNRVDFIAWG